MNRITPTIDFAAELTDLFDMRDKVVFIPGGYGGIGEAIAWALALAGARVTIAGTGRRDRRRHWPAPWSNTASAADGIVRWMWSPFRRSVTQTDSIAERYGRIDVLVNCVGIQREEPLLEVTEEAYDEVYRVNLKGAMFMAQAVAKHQIAAGKGGRQLHLLSVRAQLGLRDRGYSAYCSTKGGLVMLIKQHAMELARHGITVNGVAPTFVYTEMIRHVIENPEFRNQLLERIPLGRIADPKDVVGPVMFFCSDASAFVTGQIMYVDGGITASQ